MFSAEIVRLLDPARTTTDTQAKVIRIEQADCDVWERVGCNNNGIVLRRNSPATITVVVLRQTIVHSARIDTIHGVDATVGIAVQSRTKKEQSTKSIGSASDVPIPPALEKRLQDFLLKHFRENPSGYLFANRNGSSYAVGKVTEYGLWPVQKALGIERTGLHAFRHAAASELLEEGAPLTVVQRQLRHRDARTTLQKYGHVVGDSQRRAVESLAAKIERHTVIDLMPSAQLMPTAI